MGYNFGSTNKKTRTFKKETAMKVGVMRWLFLAFIAIVLTMSNSSHLYAASKNPKVQSLNFKGEKENKFKTNESVYVQGKKFKPLTNVDIYVTKNRKWTFGDLLSDMSTDGIESVQTTSKGRIPKTRVWGAPIVKGKYDIIVDANQDGTFDTRDAVDGKGKKPGFKVKRIFP